MTVTIGISAKDAQQAYDLLEFIAQLGGCQQYPLLLVIDAAVDWSIVTDLVGIGSRAFDSVAVRCTDTPVEGWPAGANALWLLAASYAKEQKDHFLWLEPDATPIKRGWLIAIDKMRGEGYFGFIYDWPQQNIKVMSGVAVYPPEAIELIAPAIASRPTVAWDVSSAEFVVCQARPTKLIQHFYGEKNLAPTFVQVVGPNSPPNAWTLDNLDPQAVLFHRCKDSSLRDLLRRHLNLAAPGNFVVVLPFWNMDVDLLLKNLAWMKFMGMEKSHDCLLSYDRTTLATSVAKVRAAASEVFCTIQVTSYNVPHGTRFPQTAAWQHAARTMYSAYRNWVWVEPDAVPLRPDWLNVLQNVYDRCAHPFCGPVVEGMHMNGTGIYPANTPELLPRTMSHTLNAWDVEAKDEMRGNVKDIGHIFFCCWGVKDGKLNPLEGESPSFPPGSPLLNQIPKTAVIFHRSKDGTLIDRLSS
jgi:hypothetical protein